MKVNKRVKRHTVYNVVPCNYSEWGMTFLIIPSHCII